MNPPPQLRHRDGCGVTEQVRLARKIFAGGAGYRQGVRRIGPQASQTGLLYADSMCKRRLRGLRHRIAGESYGVLSTSHLVLSGYGAPHGRVHRVRSVKFFIVESQRSTATRPCQHQNDRGHLHAFDSRRRTSGARRAAWTSDTCGGGQQCSMVFCSNRCANSAAGSLPYSDDTTSRLLSNSTVASS